jgi:hypothetical protein
MKFNTVVFPANSYRYETKAVTLRVEYKLQAKYHREIGYGYRGWMEVPQSRVQWRDLNLRVLPQC